VDNLPNLDEDPVRAALAGARSLARTAARGRPARRARRRTAEDRPSRGGYSGPGPDATDPQPVGAVLAGYVGERGWRAPLNAARVFSDWATIVGADVAAHCTPATLRDGELTVRAESTAWATQLRLLSGTLLARLVAELGGDVVHKIAITGPTAPSWKHGAFSVRGARGPRDTYG
jgi:predicted nucleic acid-binding Zn ribbon protein